MIKKRKNKRTLVELFHKVFEVEGNPSDYAICFEVFEPTKGCLFYVYGEHVFTNKQSDLGERLVELYNILRTSPSEITSISFKGIAKKDSLNEFLRALGPNAGQVMVKNGKSILVHKWKEKPYGNE